MGHPGFGVGSFASANEAHLRRTVRLCAEDGAPRGFVGAPGLWTLLWALEMELMGGGAEGEEVVAGDAHGAPLGLHAGADLLVEADGRGVPFENVPLQAGA